MAGRGAERSGFLPRVAFGLIATAHGRDEGVDTRVRPLGRQPLPLEFFHGLLDQAFTVRLTGRTGFAASFVFA